ncbi:hypothetical protein ACHHYP_06770 [Achlya hypogyna]|uniref:Secreted protein n=1 Tax=Achlya hypogyna TaxID=1202772 RepID=A0A0A7CNE8_ACHHY|nr:secreted protein [Achlya hypogyna]OQR88526.1 hypothetical protein ACHHYP_06770 [Achlya hypogyna]
MKFAAALIATACACFATAQTTSSPSPNWFLSIDLVDSADVKVNMKVNPGTEAYLVGLFEASQTISAQYVCGILGPKVSKVNFLLPQGATPTAGTVEYFVEDAAVEHPSKCDINVVAPVSVSLRHSDHVKSVQVARVAVTGTTEAPESLTVDLTAESKLLTVKMQVPAPGATTTTFTIA